MAGKALLVMDVQAGILERLGDTADAYVASVQKLVDAAHAATVPVIFVVVRFRKDFPEVSARNKSFSSIKEQGGERFYETAPDAQPVIQPTEADYVVTKRRVSAFTGSDLEVLLRGLDVIDLSLCGIATSGVVLSTVREAADKDFRLTVIADACFDSDPEVHALLTTKVFPRQADVVTVDEWIAQKN